MLMGMVTGHKDIKHLWRPLAFDLLTHLRHRCSTASFLHDDAEASPQSGFSSEIPPGPNGSST